MVGEPKKEKGVRNWFRKKFGEAPVLASKRAVNINTEIISNYLNNEGYFRSTAIGELIIKGKKAIGRIVKIGLLIFVIKTMPHINMMAIDTKIKIVDVFSIFSFALSSSDVRFDKSRSFIENLIY